VAEYNSTKHGVTRLKKKIKVALKSSSGSSSSSSSDDDDDE